MFREGGSGPSKPSYFDFRLPQFEKSRWPKVERKRQGWKEPKCAQTQTLHVFMERKSPNLKPGTTRVSQASGPPTNPDRPGNSLQQKEARQQATRASLPHYYTPSSTAVQTTRRRAGGQYVRAGPHSRAAGRIRGAVCVNAWRRNSGPGSQEPM